MIAVKWSDAEQSILLWTMERGWTWEMFWSAFAQSSKMGSSSGLKSRVDVIVDSTATNDIPSGALGAFNRADMRRPENTGLVVIAGGSRLSDMLIGTMEKIYKVHSWRVAKSLEEAYQIIAADRAKDQKTQAQPKES